LDANLSQTLLEAYLENSGSEVKAGDDILAALLLDHALPAMQRVIRRRLRSVGPETIEDVCGAAIVCLISGLRRKREEQSPVRDFPAYACGVAVKAVAQYISDWFPERARLRRKLRLLCSSDDRFFLTQIEERWLCGLRAHRQRASALPAATEECRACLSATRLPREFSAFAILFFRRLGAPVGLGEATAAFAVLLGVSGPPQSLDSLAHEPAAAPEFPGHPRTPAWVAQLWNEIRQLPVAQRTALLLNLRLPDGSAVELLEELGVADVNSLAGTLEMPPAELAALRGRLPLDDLEIGARLGVTRQQVINLRSAARERLRRRTKDANSTGRLPTIENEDRKAHPERCLPPQADKDVKNLQPQ